MEYPEGGIFTPQWTFQEATISHKPLSSHKTMYCLYKIIEDRDTFFKKVSNLKKNLEM